MKLIILRQKCSLKREFIGELINFKCPMLKTKMYFTSMVIIWLFFVILYWKSDDIIRIIYRKNGKN
jgi:hypothetical protein